MSVSLLLVTGSEGYARHVRASLPGNVEIHRSEDPARTASADAAGHDLVVVHSGSLGAQIDGVLERLSSSRVPVAVAADAPDLDHMLSLSRHDIRAYFNSWMADVHYRQMVDLVAGGITWFSPPMMNGALELARRARAQQDATGPPPCEVVLDKLTRREREIAADVASGLSNQEIAHVRHITERTVKSHLTRIFRKLRTRNRHALAVKLQGS
jgi:DNA-binding NarL/FixJ family response regulator